MAPCYFLPALHPEVCGPTGQDGPTGRDPDDVTFLYGWGFVGGVIFMLSLLFGVIRCCKPEWLQTLRMCMERRLQRSVNVGVNVGQIYESPEVRGRGPIRVHDLGSSFPLSLQGISREVHV